MDTKIEYIEMCRKATEIQERPYSFTCSHDNSDKIIISQSGDWYYLNRTPNTLLIVWLPRQDQLQEILLPHIIIPEGEYKFINLHIKFDDFIGKDDVIYQNKSLEQLWLMFVMYRVYKKRWHYTMKDWVSI